jgi:hypothetical protein
MELNQQYDTHICQCLDLPRSNLKIDSPGSTWQSCEPRFQRQKSNSNEEELA